jgi:hypothetical protein
LKVSQKVQTEIVEDIKNDLRELKAKTWKQKANDTNDRTPVIEGTENHRGLWSQKATPVKISIYRQL